MDYVLVVLGVLIGVFVALLNFGAGKLGSLGNVDFNYVKGTLCAIVGGIFGFVVAYGGQTVTPDIIAMMFSTFTIGGFGIVWLIDTATQIIVSYLKPQTPLSQGMAVPRK